MNSFSQIGLALYTMALALFGGAPGQSADGIKKLNNKPVGAYSFKMSDGSKFTQATGKGKVVFIDFWASWCGPCKLVSPVAQSLHKKHAAQGLVVIGANALEEKKGSQFAKAYAKEHGYSYRFAFEADDVHKKWDAAGVPTLVVIDRKGKVRWTADEWRPEFKAQLEALIQKLLAEK